MIEDLDVLRHAGGHSPQEDIEFIVSEPPDPNDVNLIHRIVAWMQPFGQFVEHADLSDATVRNTVSLLHRAVINQFKIFLSAPGNRMSPYLLENGPDVSPALRHQIDIEEGTLRAWYHALRNLIHDMAHLRHENLNALHRLYDHVGAALEADILDNQALLHAFGHRAFQGSH